MPALGERKTRKDGLAFAEWNGSAWVEHPMTAKAAAPGSGAVGGGFMRDTKADQDYLTTARERAVQSLDTARQAEQFTKLNESVPTGKGRKIPMLGLNIPFVNEPTWGDIQDTFSPKAQQMGSIAARLAPRQRAPGSGSSTDSDVKIFFDALPSLNYAGPANGEISKDITRISTRENARSSFLESYFAKNGTLLGAETAFKKWYPTYEATAGKVPASGGAAGAGSVFQGRNGAVRLVGR